MPNSDALDLGDKVARTALQITSRATGFCSKLSGIKKGEHFRSFDTFYVFGIVPLESKSSVKGWKKAIGGSFKFEAGNVHDISTLHAKIDTLEIDDYINPHRMDTGEESW